MIAVLFTNGLFTKRALELNFNYASPFTIRFRVPIYSNGKVRYVARTDYFFRGGLGLPSREWLTPPDNNLEFLLAKLCYYACY